MEDNKIRTSYGIGANIWRFQGFYSAFWLILAFLLLFRFEQSGFNESRNGFIVFIFFVILWGWINLWLQPIVQVEEDGILIKRLGMAHRKVKWNNLKLFKKVRTITRYCLIGTDPRYSIIEIKDGTIFDKRVAILSFFNDYDKLIAQIESHLDSEKGK